MTDLEFKFNNMQSYYDVAIIGGGINGVGIALDLTLRGVKVILMEKEDFGWATTWASSCLIHGGARYILHDIGVTYSSSKEAGTLIRTIPYMMSRRTFVVIPDSWIMREAFRIYMGVYDLFSLMRKSIIHKILSAQELNWFTGGSVKSKYGGILIEEYAIDPQRLSVMNALAAHENGATILNHTEVIGVSGTEPNFEIIGKNTLTSEEIRVKAKVAVNASGPWIDKIIKNLNIRLKNGVRQKLRPTKGIHILFPGKVINTILSFRAIDGRYLLLVPLEDRTILGTTDDDFFGDPDDIEILRDEVEYLIHSAERYIPGIRTLKPFSTKVGLRPTPYTYGKNEDKVTREWEIHDDFGFISVLGGKLASYRHLAEEASDYVCKKLGISKRSTTKYIFLPGAEGMVWKNDFEDATKKVISELSQFVPESIAYFLVKKYGVRAKELIKKFGLGELVCKCSQVFEGEIKWAIKEELAVTISDVSRRTWACDSLCNGIFCFEKVAKIVEKEGGIKDIKEYIRRRLQLIEPIKKYNMELWENLTEFSRKFL